MGRVGVQELRDEGRIVGVALDNDQSLLSLSRQSRPDLFEVALLQRAGVDVVEVVERDHTVAAGQQGLRDVGADEPGGAGEKNGGHALESEN